MTHFVPSRPDECWRAAVAGQTTILEAGYGLSISSYMLLKALEINETDAADDQIVMDATRQHLDAQSPGFSEDAENHPDLEDLKRCCESGDPLDSANSQGILAGMIWELVKRFIVAGIDDPATMDRGALLLAPVLKRLSLT